MSKDFRKSIYIGNIVKIFLLVMYLVFLSWRMFFYAYGNIFRISSRVYQYNLIPLRTIYNLLVSYSKYGFIVWAYNLFGNIIVFMPLGFLLASLLKRRGSLKSTLVFSFFIILFAESMQLIMKVGVFDVDDIILNLIGCLIGYFVHEIFVKYKRQFREWFSKMVDFLYYFFYISL